MEADCIPFHKTGYFSALIADYLDEKEDLKPFYHRFPQIEAFEEQIREKQLSYSPDRRSIMQAALTEQHKGLELSKKTKSNLSLLKEETTFTVVTGHQLNLFTGPLYFLYKIITTIRLTETLKKKYPDYNFVPVYWMATEDHDFDEINHFNFKGKKIQWNTKAGGAVGKLSTAGLKAVLDIFSAEIGSSKQAGQLKELFQKTYLEHETLAEATRYLANSLFGSYGLVIADGDDSNLKHLLVPFIKNDVLENTSYANVMATNQALQELSADYTIQVNPREINYFYLAEGLRERLVKSENGFQVLNTEIEFSKENLLKEIEQHPERFSPNVISRPIYQEVALPNLCYIGGGGELAYWLQLQGCFKTASVPFPLLLLRNSALLLSKKQKGKLERLNLSLSDIFLPQTNLINKKIREISNIDINFSPQRKHLKEQFEAMYSLAEETDKSFLGAVKAQEVKQLKGLDHLEKRLLKAQKTKLRDQVVRLAEIQNQLFPNQSLQERAANFSELYLELGDALIPQLMSSLKPLHQEFFILQY